MLIRFALLFALLASPLAAQEMPLLTAIDVQGNSRISRETILHYLGVKEGDPFDLEKIRANTRKLIDANLTADLQVRAEETEGGIRLIIEVTERPLLKTLAFKGNKALSANQIRDKFKEKKIGLVEGRELVQDIVQKSKVIIHEAYKEIGYPAAEVSTLLEEAGPGQLKLTLVVDEGTKVPIGDIIFVGNTLFNEKKLRWAMKKSKEHTLISMISKHDLYSAESFRDDAEKIKALYKAKGYKDVKVGEPHIETYLADPEKPKKKRLRLTIPIDEGRQFLIRNVAITGATVFPKERLEKEIRMSHGEILNFQKLQDVNTSIQELYNSKGYISAGINPQFEEVGGEDNLLDITLQVEEGEQFRVGRVEFRGNTKTRDKVLRRELGISEGEVFNASSFRSTLMRLNQLGYFKLNEEKPVEPDIDPETKQINLTLFGEESAKTDLQFAAGYSELDGFFGQFSFSTRNFLGRGETLSLGYTGGKRRTFYELSYVNPWFLDTPNSISGTLYNRHMDYRTFVRDSKGLGIGYGYRLATFSSLTFYYNYERILAQQDKDLRYRPYEDGDHPRPVEDPHIGGMYAENRGTASSITPTLRWDTRDDPFDPFKGMYVSASARFAGGLLGGTIDLFKPELAFTYYQPLRRNWTTMVHAEAGSIIQTGGRIPSYERYFLGGENSLRGFSWRSVYPVNPIEGTQGGTKYLQFNFDSIWRLQQAFRFVAFLDAGYCWDETTGYSRMSFGDMRASTGFELRIFMPVFTAPLRFIYGIILDPQPHEDRTNFQFTIGTSF